MENLRIIDAIEKELEYVNKKAGLARVYVRQLHTKVSLIRILLSKYGIVDIDYSNIYFTNENEYTKKIEELNALCNIVITFNKDYSELQMYRILKLIDCNHFRFKDNDSYDFSKGKYTKPSNKVVFELRFQQ